MKTSKDLYNGVEMEEMADRAKTRDAINAGSLGKVMTGADKMVNSLLDILQFGEHGESIKGSNKAFAREIMTKLGNPGAFNNKTKSIVMTTAPVMFTLQENGNVVAKVALDNGNIFSMDTGLDRQGLADKAVDALNSTILPTQPSVESLRAERKKSADDEIMNSINEIETGEIEPERKAVAMSNEDLLKGFGLLFNALKKARGPAERKGLREANMEDAVKALQQALDKVRKLDNRNTQLINQVREVFYGNKDVDPDLLLKSISDVLNKKTVDPKDTILKNIESKIQDDLDENLNINAWLGEDVETKVDDVNVEG